MNLRIYLRPAFPPSNARKFARILSNRFRLFMPRCSFRFNDPALFSLSLSLCLSFFFEPINGIAKLYLDVVIRPRFSKKKIVTRCETGDGVLEIR